MVDSFIMTVVRPFSLIQSFTQPLCCRYVPSYILLSIHSPTVNCSHSCLALNLSLHHVPFTRSHAPPLAYEFLRLLPPTEAESESYTMLSVCKCVCV